MKDRGGGEGGAGSVQCIEIAYSETTAAVERAQNVIYVLYYYYILHFEFFLAKYSNQSFILQCITASRVKNCKTFLEK